MSKKPSLRQAPTGPTIYPPMKLPPVVNVPKTIDPGLAQLGRIAQPAPQPALNRTPAPTMNPAPGLTNRPGVPVK
jgi:hypothetical protein